MAGIMALHTLATTEHLILDRGGWEVIEEKNSKNKISKAFAKPSDNGLR